MLGICAAVNATTRYPGSSRKTMLKLWKSRPAAPMMMTRVTKDPPEGAAIIPQMQIVAVVLAAGAGRRMGGPKALLRMGGETFLARAARILARPGVRAVVAVLGHDADRVR